MKLFCLAHHSVADSKGARAQSATSKQHVRLAPESGQALLEYLLLLTLSLMIIMGGLYQLSTAFQSFAKSYFGDYLECLLETGELPVVGQEGGICASSYQPFSFSRGRPLVDTSGSGSSGNSTSGSGSTGTGGTGSGSGSSGRDGAGGSGGLSGRDSRISVPRIAPPGGGDKTASESGDSSGGSGSSAGSGLAGGRRFTPISATANNKSASAQGESIELTAAENREAQGRSDVQAFKRLSGSAQDEAVGRLRFVPSDTGAKQNQESKTITVTNADTKMQKGRRIAAINKKAGNSSDEDKDMQGLSLPDFLRYLVIAGIIAVVLVFFGGQIAAFRKGSEKS